MEMYSPNFFKQNFTENLNHFKAQSQKEVVVEPEVSKEKVAFKVKEIRKVEKILITNENMFKNIINLTSHRVSKLKEYFYNLASTFFKEEAV